jgi:hypothetical protein
MFTMMRGLHAIAAERGDGLRPELLQHLCAEPEPAPPAGETKVAEMQEIESIIEFLHVVGFC